MRIRAHDTTFDRSTPFTGSAAANRDTMPRAIIAAALVCFRRDPRVLWREMVAVTLTCCVDRDGLPGSNVKVVIAIVLTPGFRQRENAKFTSLEAAYARANSVRRFYTGRPLNECSLIARCSGAAGRLHACATAVQRCMQFRDVSGNAFNVLCMRACTLNNGITHSTSRVTNSTRSPLLYILQTDRVYASIALPHTCAASARDGHRAPR